MRMCLIGCNQYVAVHGRSGSVVETIVEIANQKSYAFVRLRCNSGLTRVTRSSSFLTTASLFLSYC